jgi:hypothetical protein
MTPRSLPTSKISNPDVTRLINSDEIQSVVRPAGQKIQKRPWTQKKNPLVNKAVLFRLNPYAKTIRRQEIRASPSLSLFLLLHTYNRLPVECSQAGAPEEEEREEAQAAHRRRRGVHRHPLRSLKTLSLWIGEFMRYEYYVGTMLLLYCAMPMLDPCLSLRRLESSTAFCSARRPRCRVKELK